MVRRWTLARNHIIKGRGLPWGLPATGLLGRAHTRECSSNDRREAFIPR